MMRVGMPIKYKLISPINNAQALHFSGISIQNRLWSPYLSIKIATFLSVYTIRNE
jgi:hypothetical protein